MMILKNELLLQAKLGVSQTDDELSASQTEDKLSATISFKMTASKTEV